MTWTTQGSRRVRRISSRVSFFFSFFLTQLTSFVLAYVSFFVRLFPQSNHELESVATSTMTSPGSRRVRRVSSRVSFFFSLFFNSTNVFCTSLCFFGSSFPSIKPRKRCNINDDIAGLETRQTRLEPWWVSFSLSFHSANVFCTSLCFFPPVFSLYQTIKARKRRRNIQRQQRRARDTSDVSRA